MQDKNENFALHKLAKMMPHKTKFQTNLTKSPGKTKACQSTEDNDGQSNHWKQLTDHIRKQPRTIKNALALKQTNSGIISFWYWTNSQKNVYANLFLTCKFKNIKLSYI